MSDMLYCWAQHVVATKEKPIEELQLLLEFFQLPCFDYSINTRLFPFYTQVKPVAIHVCTPRQSPSHPSTSYYYDCAPNGISTPPPDSSGTSAVSIAFFCDQQHLQWHTLPCHIQAAYTPLPNPPQWPAAIQTELLLPTPIVLPLEIHHGSRNPSYTLTTEKLSAWLNSTNPTPLEVLPLLCSPEILLKPSLTFQHQTLPNPKYRLTLIILACLPGLVIPFQMGYATTYSKLPTNTEATQWLQQCLHQFLLAQSSVASVHNLCLPYGMILHTDYSYLPGTWGIQSASGVPLLSLWFSPHTTAIEATVRTDQILPFSSPPPLRTYNPQQLPLLLAYIQHLGELQLLQQNTC